MSIDLYLRIPAKPSRKSIETILFSMGWEKADPDSSWQYYWFEDYRSLRGCRLDIFTSRQRFHTPFPSYTKTMFWVNTAAGRSHDDLCMQNNVLRTLKAKFGGSIYNPQTGSSAYFDTEVIPKLSRAELRCAQVYWAFRENMGKVGQLVQDIPTVAEKPEDRERVQSIIANNLILPFLTASLETFWTDFFIAYLEESPPHLHTWYSKGGKSRQWDYESVSSLLTNESSLASLEAERRSFQSLERLFENYKDLLNIDLEKLLVMPDRRKKKKGAPNRMVHVKRKLGTKMIDILQTVNELLRLRHRIVHGAFIDTNLEKTRALTYMFAVEKFVELFILHLEKQGFRVNTEKFV